MAESTVLNVFPRTVIGKANRHLAAEGRIPAVLYGMGRDALPISVDRHDFELFMSHHAAGSTLVEIQIEGEKTPVNAMIREMQREALKGTILHVDFFAVSLDKPISATVSLRLVNDPAGVRAGGVLTTERHEINVEAKPAEIPEFIEVDVAALEIGDSIHISDIVAPAGVTLTDEPDALVASVVPPAAEVEEEAGAEQAEPEVIGAKDEGE
ncbi:MAG: 50S ribosomal protein L25 [Coriobacteriia bacterium]|nr:50S ribosomal protein L25 [Coriobacteriia bacterium]